MSNARAAVRGVFRLGPALARQRGGKRGPRRRFSAALLALRVGAGALASWAVPAPARCAPPPPGVVSVTPQAALPLEVSAAKLLRLQTPAAKVFVTDPSVADVQLPSDRSTFIWGKKPGRTALFALSRSGAVIQSYMLEVRFNEAERIASLAATWEGPG